MKGASLVLLLTVTSALASHHNNHHNKDNNITDESVWQFTYDLLLECSQKPSMMVCLKLKAVKFLDKAAVSKDPFPIIEYLTFSPDASVKEDEEEREQFPSEADVEASLPRSLDDQSGYLDQMIQDKIGSILHRRTLQLTLPMDFEGRGKKGKYGAALLIGLGMAGMIGQLIMGKIALIAGKALVIAKVALVLSAIVGLKKLFGKNNDGDTSVVYAGGGEGGWGHRSLTDPPDMEAHGLAYNAHADQILR